MAVILATACLWACGGANQGSNCEPETITAKGRCFWEKNQACDAIGCVPPDECVVNEGKPASVECKKQPK